MFDKFLAMTPDFSDLFALIVTQILFIFIDFVASARIKDIGDIRCTLRKIAYMQLKLNILKKM